MEGLVILVIGQDDAVKATIQSMPGTAAAVLAMLEKDRRAGPGVLLNKDEFNIPASADMLQPDEGPFKYLLQNGGAGAGADTTTGGVGMDRTRDFINSIVLPTALPSVRDLPGLFSRGQGGSPPLRKRDGSVLKLPVHPAVYEELRHIGGVAELVEPDHLSQAWALSVAVSSVLHPRTALHKNLDDELSVAGHIDELFSRIISIANDTLPGCVLTRKRNHSDASITRRLARPDFLIFCRDTLLFKGEDEAHDGAWRDVKMDLESKVRRWSEAYLGQLEYLLCYGAVGFQFQLFFLTRGHAEAQDLSAFADTGAPMDKIYVIHTALLVWSILRLQVPLLPQSACQLEREIRREDGSVILFGDDHVKKTVPLSVFRDLGADADHLKRLYTAVEDSDYVVHAIEGPTLGKHHYTVCLQPLGRPLSPTLMSGCPAMHVKKAIRCCLLGLKSIHKAGMGHGDLRWENVIGIGTGTGTPTAFDSYCIIDLELAQVLGSMPTLQPRPRAWGPNGEALVDGRYQAASDLYQLGSMLRETGAATHDQAGRVLEHLLLQKAITVDAALQHEWLGAA